jgi:uncharacterized protein (TIGR02147 family)
VKKSCKPFPIPADKEHWSPQAMPETIIDIFQYLDYRRYLKDYYQAKKAQKGSVFSYRSFSRAAGFSAPNFLQLVSEGKRNLSLDGIKRFAKGLRLKREEARFFEHLVKFNQASTDEARNKWYQQLAASKRYKEIKEIEKAHFDYFSHWYYSAIRELVLLPDFKEDPEWIAQALNPPIQTDEAEAALALLLRLGFLQRNDQGRLMQAEDNLTTEQEVRSLAVANYHRQMMNKAATAIECTPSQHRDISSLTMAVSKEQFLEAKRRIQEFRRELNVLLSANGDADAVYQINFQIFNLSELPWSKK